MASSPKWDFYQTDTNVTLTILKRGVTLEQCQVNYDNQTLTVNVDGQSILDIALLNPVDPDNLQLKCTPSKIEVNMTKLIGQHWATLQKKTEERVQKTSSSNWDKMAKEADDEDEEAEGDTAVNKMFQKIYADADDDVKKAMMKSYMESGGTVLSTNWNEIQKKKTEVKPPDGMEYKKWEH